MEIWVCNIWLSRIQDLERSFPLGLRFAHLVVCACSIFGRPLSLSVQLFDRRIRSSALSHANTVKILKQTFPEPIPG